MQPWDFPVSANSLTFQFKNHVATCSVVVQHMDSNRYNWYNYLNNIYQQFQNFIACRQVFSFFPGGVWRKWRSFMYISCSLFISHKRDLTHAKARNATVRHKYSIVRTTKGVRNKKKKLKIYTQGNRGKSTKQWSGIWSNCTVADR